jgi:acyl-coenzyme A synthetase/AMP-(fatty) acid ligase
LLVVSLPFVTLWQALIHSREGLGIPCFTFEIEHVTIPALIERFGESSDGNIPNVLSSPNKDDVAIYIFTSGASSVANLKPVPLTHESLFDGSVSTIAWLKKTYPETDYTRLRALGWAPWTFLLSFNCDIGGFTLLTGGCYVFALVPSSYASSEAEEVVGYDGLPGRILKSILDKKIDTFSCVPLVYEGIMAIYQESDEMKRKSILSALRAMKSLMCGGAKTNPEAIAWACEIGLALNLGIGMTELGRKYFAVEVIPSFVSSSPQTLCAVFVLGMTNLAGP